MCVVVITGFIVSTLGEKDGIEEDIIATVWNVVDAIIVVSVVVAESNGEDTIAVVGVVAKSNDVAVFSIAGVTVAGNDDGVNAITVVTFSVLLSVAGVEAVAVVRVVEESNGVDAMIVVERAVAECNGVASIGTVSVESMTCVGIICALSVAEDVGCIATVLVLGSGGQEGGLACEQTRGLIFIYASKKSSPKIDEEEPAKKCKTVNIRRRITHRISMRPVELFRAIHQRQSRR